MCLRIGKGGRYAYGEESEAIHNEVYIKPA